MNISQLQLKIVSNRKHNLFAMMLTLALIFALTLMILLMLSSCSDGFNGSFNGGVNNGLYYESDEVDANYAKNVVSLTLPSKQAPSTASVWAAESAAMAESAESAESGASAGSGASGASETSAESGESAASATSVVSETSAKSGASATSATSVASAASSENTNAGVSETSAINDEDIELDVTVGTTGSSRKSSVYQDIDFASLDNRKIGWGVKLNGNKQPEAPKAMTDTLNKYDAVYIGNADDMSLYLTFDMGYENGYTAKILDTLRANDVKCAFFITGDYLDRSSEFIERMLDEGHIVANHSDKHTSFPDDSIEKVRRELTDLNDRFFEQFGCNMTYSRPPMGEYSERVLAICAQEGYRTVLWSFAYEDYDVNNQRGVNYAYNKIMDNLHSGAVILLHAVSKDNAGMLDRFIKDAKALGYSFKTLDDM